MFYSIDLLAHALSDHSSLFTLFAYLVILIQYLCWQCWTIFLAETHYSTHPGVLFVYQFHHFLFFCINIILRHLLLIFLSNCSSLSNWQWQPIQLVIYSVPLSNTCLFICFSFPIFGPFLSQVCVEFVF